MKAVAVSSLFASARTLLFVLALFAVSGSTAFAHPGHRHTPGGDHGLAAGFFHPLFGLDHLLAMFAVGLLAAHLGGRAIWILPASFLGVMIVGGYLGFAAVPLPGIEMGIALSVVALGVALAVGTRYPLVAAAIACGLFGLLHGHAHGTELPALASATLYSLGFVIATALLHAAGIGAGLLVTGWQRSPVALRFAGAAISLAGVAILTKPLWS